MKNKTYIIMILAAFAPLGCSKEKSAINQETQEIKNEIDGRKSVVDAEAKEATLQVETNAAIDKARIEANKISMQAQLDADKEKAEAEAEAAKERTEAEPR